MDTHESNPSIRVTGDDGFLHRLGGFLICRLTRRVQKYVRKFNLDMRWDSSGKPVLDTLHTPGCFVVSKQFCNLGRATKVLNEFGIFFHGG